MIEFQKVSMAFGAQDILDEVSFRIGDGERVGIVGPNGAGKSTVFSLITGELTPDEGQVNRSNDLTIGHLHQQLQLEARERTLIEYAENALPEVQTLQREIAELEKVLTEATLEIERSRLLRRLGQAQSEFEHRGGYELSHRAESILCGLGFRKDELSRPFGEFSGGWQMRAELARVLSARPNLLLLDEPTNFLDIPAVEWLQRYLKEYPGTLILVAHDRYLLNTLTTVTIEVAGAQATRYTGNYDAYLRTSVQRNSQLEAAQANQDRRREQIERFVERFRAKNTKSTQVQSRIKMLEKMEIVTVPRRVFRAIPIRLRPPPHCGQEIFRFEDAGITYDGTNWVLRHVDLRVDRGEKLALVGLNGMGKTTLLRAMAGRIQLGEGRRILGHKVVLGYQAQDFAEQLNPEQTILNAVKSADMDLHDQTVRTLLGSFFFTGDDVEKPISVLSGGEKMRVALARLLIQSPNCLLMDEPTTHLDIPSREALEYALQQYTGTLVLVSHDIEFVRRVATGIISMVPQNIQRYAGNYDYYREKADREAGLIVQEAKAEEAAMNKPIDRKTMRREKAQRRETRNKLLRPLQERVRKAEETVNRLEKEQVLLVEELGGPTVGLSYSHINQRLTEIQKLMAAATRDWETALLQLEEVEKENPLEAEGESGEGG
jgi:ATP-binding cassette subfamily F protein 3